MRVVVRVVAKDDEAKLWKKDNQTALKPGSMYISHICFYAVKTEFEHEQNAKSVSHTIMTSQYKEILESENFKPIRVSTTAGILDATASGGWRQWLPTPEPEPENPCPLRVIVPTLDLREPWRPTHWQLRLKKVLEQRRNGEAIYVRLGYIRLKEHM